LLLGVIGINFLVSSVLKDTKKSLFTFSIVANIGLLVFFKYTNFLIEVAQDIAGMASLYIEQSKLSIVLPLGISFIAFQLVAYIIDVRRGVIEREKSLLRFSVFVSFFPQLIAGPICRGSEFLPQLRVLQPFRRANFVQGLMMLCIGLFLKVGIADNLSSYIELVYDKRLGVDTAHAWIATIAFSAQILCDFWGYSTMALGTALMFGLTIPANFNLPYVATTLQSFWRRWHITLSFWLRDYLYYTFGGNRSGVFRTGINLVAVMAIGGLWHGASYNFIIWGLIHGCWLLLERYAIAGIRCVTIPELVIKGWRPVGWLITMLVVSVAWVFFRADNLGDAMFILHHMFVMSGDFSLDSGDVNIISVLVVFALMMIPLHLLNQAGLNTNFYKSVKEQHNQDLKTGVTADNMPWQIPPVALSGSVKLCGDILLLPSALKLAVAFWLLVLAVVLGAGESVPFIYFQF